ncbi:biotin--[acetyl-CoA-carboxylase] ligase [Siccirubricoccus sp. G192]|uniref:biotin--[acetyl-CoA-carboxylase] ligase n=1 Tax=Siccirubricoccus sp. G192 TaxID=2849651 RepID=UPI001C2B795A|nr:biotin--[acetyl-CoA-carboxylase] ligase [Siccirubricoccus sp. G192]MBV1798305.1 biotin--[acetyl-CoA-carboxylase] ligase [Siccirubricoccus sp. G192]
MIAPAGWRVELHSALPSTSDRLTGLAEAGEAECLVILAGQQTAGRGRSGRAWSSPPGNLYLSALLRPAGPARDAAQWSLLAGVALAEAARGIDPEPDALRLKWPNDLLRHGAKCGGILAESSLRSDGGLAWLVLGFGVNLMAAPALPDRPTACLGRAVPPEDFASHLLARLDHWRRLQAAEGFAPIRAAWAGFGPGHGQVIAVRRGTGTIAGGFAGLAPDGSLLLESGGIRLSITAGEVQEQEARSGEAL